MDVWFSSIGSDLTVRVPVAVIPGRDQINLFNSLFRSLGFIEAFEELPKEVRDQVYAKMTEVSKKTWNA